MVPAARYRLAGSGPLSATVAARGGALVGLAWTPPEGGKPLLLVLDPDTRGYDREADEARIGVIVGRVAGRIRNSAYVSGEGTIVRLTANQGPHHLHGGGPGALGRLDWTLVQETGGDRPELTLACRSADGSEGYPGNLEAEARWTLDGDTLHLRLQAFCDLPCPVNLTAHPYFNLSGGGLPATGQRLQIAASRLCELGPDLVPTGRILPARGAAKDWQAARTIGMTGLDDIYLLNARERPAATLFSPATGLALDVMTDRAALVAYDGAHLPACFAEAGGGICLEPQDVPLALKAGGAEHAAGELWESRISYRVSRRDSGQPSGG